ncbi:hypothetical protein H4R35_006796 [Dimargaris xerosporica]|nr:hypothetical protein H4R35_006796 [Dimargaris xerosporica]
MPGLARAKSLMAHGAKDTQFRLLNRIGRYRTPQQLYDAAQSWVEMHQMYLYQTPFWTQEESTRRARSLLQRDKDAQLRGTILVRLVRLRLTPELKVVKVTVPEFYHTQADIQPYKYGNEVRVEVWLELKPEDQFYQAAMAVMSQKFGVQF